MRYPTRNGLAIGPSELGLDTPEHQKGKTNNHHLYFRRQSYNCVPHRQIFRGLVPHVQPLWIAEHTALHERYDPPKMPQDNLMIDVIEEYLSLNGVLDVVREHQTNSSYQLTAHQWEGIKRGYSKAS
jgi:hypothetical protein